MHSEKSRRGPIVIVTQHTTRRTDNIGDLIGGARGGIERCKPARRVFSGLSGSLIPNFQTCASMVNKSSDVNQNAGAQHEGLMAF